MAVALQMEVVVVLVLLILTGNKQAPEQWSVMVRKTKVGLIHEQCKYSLKMLPAMFPVFRDTASSVY